MAKHLGKVPIPGSVVECHGLRLEAERATGRRNKIETVLVTVLGDDDAAADDAHPGVSASGR
jgi:CBS domain containing-hemolysin-like protein